MTFYDDFGGERKSHLNSNGSPLAEKLIQDSGVHRCRLRPRFELVTRNEIVALFFNSALRRSEIELNRTVSDERGRGTIHVTWKINFCNQNSPNLLSLTPSPRIPPALSLAITSYVIPPSSNRERS